MYGLTHVADGASENCGSELYRKHGAQSVPRMVRKLLLMFGRYLLLARNSHYQIMGRKLCTKRHYCCLNRLAIIARCPNTPTGYLREGGNKYLDQQYADVCVRNARCGFE